MGVLLRDGLNCGHQVACYGRREAETGLQSGWSNVNKHAIGDGLRAGVAEDDLSEKALGAVCFAGLEVVYAIFNLAKRQQAFCVPKGLARSRATEGRRNGINGGDPLAGSRRFMPDSLYP